MSSPKITTSAILATSRAKTDETYPVKLRVTYNRENRKYGTAISLTKEDFDKATGTKPRGIHKDHSDDLRKLERRADAIIKAMPEFSFQTFGEQWYSETTNKATGAKDVFSAFDQVIQDMEQQNRIGTAISYQCALNSLKNYTSAEVLSFKQITPDFLTRYERWMTEGGQDRKANSVTTVGIYLRCLRALFNSAISAGIVPQEAYPFGSIKKKKYSIPAPRSIKKALSMQDIKKIFDYHPTNSAESLYRDLWIFSYLCNGANIKDICLLKYSDIDTSRRTITFRRAKTSNTNRNSKPIVAAYTDQLRDIVHRWGNEPAPTAFVFPFLKHSGTAREIKATTNQVIKMTNKHINRIAAAVEIPGHITTYTARHSFATALKRAGVNTSFISESMGHSDQKTTEAYLGSIEDDQRDEIAGHLTNFYK